MSMQWKVSPLNEVCRGHGPPGEYALDFASILDNRWPFQVHLYKSYPLRRSSRIVGKVMNMEIPEWLRPLVMGVFVHRYDVQMRDAEVHARHR